MPGHVMYNGAEYDIIQGRTLCNGVESDIIQGRTVRNGIDKDILFGGSGIETTIRVTSWRDNIGDPLDSMYIDITTDLDDNQYIDSTGTYYFMANSSFSMEIYVPSCSGYSTIEIDNYEVDSAHRSSVRYIADERDIQIGSYITVQALLSSSTAFISLSTS